MGRVFRRDGDIVTLLALPRTSDVGADTLVVLLYGFLKILGRNAVTGVTLAKAARQPPTGAMEFVVNASSCLQAPGTFRCPGPSPFASFWLKTRARDAAEPFCEDGRREEELPAYALTKRTLSSR